VKSIESFTKRIPIVTAIRATEIVAANSKARADRKETVNTFMVSRVYLSPISSMRALWVVCRPNILRVIKPRSESSKYEDNEPRVRHFLDTESAV